MHTTLKRIVATVAVAGAVTAGTAGAAFAADGSSGAGAGAATSQTVRHPALRAEIRKGAVKIALDTLGVSRADAKAALKGGMSISEYATSIGKDPQSVVDALVNAANSKIDELVANGTIQQARADTIKSKVPDRVNKLVNRHFGQHAAAPAPTTNG